ncbi:hypothetical protein JZ751_007479 [Albula glossodonta]|uniref:Suppressor of cytokine signaling 3 n=1 Tax=Albula glossodonta TaxID=121402 RepID=A0A8T2N314_9TELE|nr:hypothetical protein JZ751_007479 [Albula glossodonta]
MLSLINKEKPLKLKPAITRCGESQLEQAISIHIHSILMLMTESASQSGARDLRDSTPCPLLFFFPTFSPQLVRVSVWQFAGRAARGSLGRIAMVTHSKFEPYYAMSIRPFPPDAGPGLPPHRFKTFCSSLQLQLVQGAVHKLQQSGFYWGTLSGKEANGLLGSQPTGTFLVRDSSDHHHFFTLSVKTASGTKNLRIQCDNCSFFLQTDPKTPAQAVPKFDCVLKLVHHYMPSSKAGAGVPSDGSGSYYIYSGGEKVPLELRRPLSCCMSSLQHLCRKTVNGHLDASSKSDQLPDPLRDFLQEYDAPI